MPRQHLILRPGPQLLMRGFRPEPDDVGGRWSEVDVTGRAHELLFDLVTIHAETTLADIFRLMEASPLLQKLYRLDFAEELCAEARKGAIEPPAHEGAPMKASSSSSCISNGAWTRAQTSTPARSACTCTASATNWRKTCRRQERRRANASNGRFR